MRLFPSRSVPGQGLSARERRTVAIAVIVSVLALLVVRVVLPFADKWRTREDVIAADLDRLARLRGLLSNQSRLDQAVRERASSFDSTQQRLLQGRTPALAASALQSMIQGFANQSRVTVSRLDVAGAPDTTAGALPMIPATVSAVGDIYGITEMLTLMQHGPALLEITELNVRPNPALRGGLLQMTVTLRGGYTGG